MAAVASRDVRLFEVRRFSVGKTIGLVLPLIVVGLAVIAIVDCYNYDIDKGERFCLD